MKRFVMLATVLLIAASGFSQVPRVRGKDPVTPYTAVAAKAVWQRTYAAADTVATTGKFRDTVYSPWYEVPAGSKYFLTYYVDGKNARGDNGYKDTLRANDSISLQYQVSLDGREISAGSPYTMGALIPGSADLDTMIFYAQTLARDTIFMRSPFFRTMAVVKDSSVAARPGLVGNTYSTSITLFLTARP